MVASIGTHKTLFKTPSKSSLKRAINHFVHQSAATLNTHLLSTGAVAGSPGSSGPARFKRSCKSLSRVISRTASPNLVARCCLALTSTALGVCAGVGGAISYVSMSRLPLCPTATHAHAQLALSQKSGGRLRRAGIACQSVRGGEWARLDASSVAKGRSARWHSPGWQVPGVWWNEGGQRENEERQ